MNIVNFHNVKHKNSDVRSVQICESLQLKCFCVRDLLCLRTLLNCKGMLQEGEGTTRKQDDGSKASITLKINRLKDKPHRLKQNEQKTQLYAAYKKTQFYL